MLWVYQRRFAKASLPAAEPAAQAKGEAALGLRRGLGRRCTWGCVARFLQCTKGRPAEETVVTRSSKFAPAPPADRIARARAEGRTQQALDLTRQLAKQSPSPEHEELLRQVTLERGMQLQQQGH